jgi:hypothetical protein
MMNKTGDAKQIGIVSPTTPITEHDEAYIVEFQDPLEEKETQQKLCQLLHLPTDLIGKRSRFIWKVLK